MDVHTFLSPDILDGIPPGEQAAFTYLAREARKILISARRDLHDEDWEGRQDVQFTYTNVVLNAAKRYKIAPLKDIEIPRRKEFDSDTFRDIQNDIDGYLVQLILSGVEAGREASVEMTPPAKSYIRTRLSGIKEAVDRLDLPKPKIEKLHKRLRDFEEELDRKRTNYAAVMVMATHVLTGVAGASVEPIVSKLVGEVIQEVGKAKETEEEARLNLLPQGDFLHLEAPRKQVTGPKESFDLDDELPF